MKNLVELVKMLNENNEARDGFISIVKSLLTLKKTIDIKVPENSNLSHNGGDYAEWDEFYKVSGSPLVVIRHRTSCEMMPDTEEICIIPDYCWGCKDFEWSYREPTEGPSCIVCENGDKFHK